MLLLSHDGLSRLRRRGKDPAFEAAWQRLRARADSALALGLTPPVLGAGWYHAFFCPSHGTELVFDPASPHSHRCPADGETYRGEPFDSAWRHHAHTALAAGARDAALAWLMTEEETYASHVATTLGAYADLYARYPPHGEIAGQGRAMGQSLDEATWAVAVARAYDCVRGGLTATARAHIEQDLLRPAGEHLLGELAPRVHNVECWHLAALATLGVVTGDDRFVSPVIDGAFGLDRQLRDGVLADGWWYEGSAGYHFYTLEAVSALLSALRHREPAILGRPQLRDMFAAPLRLARADLTLPALNDGWTDVTRPPGVGRYAALYELAWGLWHDPAHAGVLAQVHAGGGLPRDSVEALLYGPEAAGLSAAPTAVLPSVRQTGLCPASGYAVLQERTPCPPAPGTERWLLLKYGPHGGFHGHPDKLSLDLHAFGHRLSPDLGTPGYGVPATRTWYQQTLAHNTVVLGEQSQPPGTGHLLAFRPVGEDGAEGTGQVGVADAVVGWPDAPEQGPYAGVRLRRCLLWRPGPDPYVLDVVLVDSPGPQRIDLAWHHLGTLVAPPAAEPGPVDIQPANATYALLEQVHRLPVQGTDDAGGRSPRTVWTAEWRLDDVPDIGTRIWGIDERAATVWSARAPADPPADRMAFLLRRVEGAQACFVSVLEPFRGAARVRRVRREPGCSSASFLRVSVDMADGACEQWTLDIADAYVSDTPLVWTLARRGVSVGRRH
ncbi:heparinase II/III family protein [Streptomyces sp. NPDC026294]|uniref:heparinase II/III domain-containing protein n=1 Tax=Streptomyces sp. NPDC026294 TaxID=3155362 RepID=UPI0033FCFB3C